MKPPYCVSEVGNHWFAAYHSHYKEKLGMTKTAYDSCLRYKSDRLGIIASVCQPEASFDPSHAAQKVKFSPDNIALLNKQLQWKINNKYRGLRYVKLDQDTLGVLSAELYGMAHGFDIGAVIKATLGKMLGSAVPLILCTNSTCVHRKVTNHFPTGYFGY